MKRILTIVFALLVIAMPSFANEYGWTVSASSAEPFQNTGGLTPGGLGHLFVWYYCSVGGGMSASDFGLAATGLVLEGVAPLNGFLNAGSGNNLLLAVGGCPTGPVCALDCTVLYLGGPGSLCIANSNNVIRVTVDCTFPGPIGWPLHAIGWDALAAPVCSDPAPLCSGPVAVESQGWGQVKSLYR